MSILSHFVNSKIKKISTSGNGLYRATHDGIEFFICDIDGWKRIVEDPQRESKVNGDIFVSLSFLAHEEFDNFNTNSTHNHGSCSSNGRDNLSSN